MSQKNGRAKRSENGLLRRLRRFAVISDRRLEESIPSKYRLSGRHDRDDRKITDVAAEI